MIPSIFREENLRKAKGSGEAGRALAMKAASIESGAALGFIGAIGACGGYLIPRGFGASIAADRRPAARAGIYLAFYATCLALTWWYYLRKSFLRRAPRISPRRVCEASARAATTNNAGMAATPPPCALVEGTAIRTEVTDDSDESNWCNRHSSRSGRSSRRPRMFYGRLFEIAPEVKPLFKGDMAEQGRKLMATLAVVVGSLHNLETILPAVSTLAKKHVEYGVKPGHYAAVGAALLWTLERGLGAAWTPELAAAWTSAYTTLSHFMIGEAYGRVAAE